MPRALKTLQGAPGGCGWQPGQRRPEKVDVYIWKKRHGTWRKIYQERRRGKEKAEGVARSGEKKTPPPDGSTTAECSRGVSRF